MPQSNSASAPQLKSLHISKGPECLHQDPVQPEPRHQNSSVLPKANVKIFLTASAEVRAQRRHLELQAKGGKDSFEKVLSEIKQRDHQDSTRASAPLKQAKDAVLVDTSDMDIQAVITEIRRIVAEKVGA